MKSKLIAIALVFCSLGAYAQFFYQKIAKSTFKAEIGKTVVFKSGNITVTTTKEKVSAILNGKTIVLATPTKGEDVQVTAYDLNGDKKPEIFVAFKDVNIVTSTVLVYDGKSLKKIGEVPTGDFFEFKKNAIIGNISHHEITEKHIYHLKNGKFVLDEKNSIY